MTVALAYISVNETQRKAMTFLIGGFRLTNFGDFRMTVFGQFNPTLTVVKILFNWINIMGNNMGNKKSGKA